jgi:hypothetical protein
VTADAFEADAFEVEGDHYIAVVADGKRVPKAEARAFIPCPADPARNKRHLTQKYQIVGRLAGAAISVRPEQLLIILHRPAAFDANHDRPMLGYLD